MTSKRNADVNVNINLNLILTFVRLTYECTGVTSRRNAICLTASFGMRGRGWRIYAVTIYEIKLALHVKYTYNLN